MTGVHISSPSPSGPVVLGTFVETTKVEFAPATEAGLRAYVRANAATCFWVSGVRSVSGVL